MLLQTFSLFLDFLYPFLNHRLRGELLSCFDMVQRQTWVKTNLKQGAHIHQPNSLASTSIHGCHCLSDLMCACVRYWPGCGLVYVCPYFKLVRLGLTRFQQREKGKGIEFFCGKPMMPTAVTFYHSNYYYCVLLLLLLSIVWPIKQNNVALLTKKYAYGQWNAQFMHSREKKLFSADNGLLGCITVPAVVVQRITESFRFEDEDVYEYDI